MKQSDALGPLVQNDNDPVFDEGWQAQVLALAFTLVEQGQFSNVEWSEALGSELVQSKQRGDPDNSNSYYQAVLSAIEKLLDKKQRLTSSVLDERTEAWRGAYLRTPHGQPVKLE